MITVIKILEDKNMVINKWNPKKHVFKDNSGLNHTRVKNKLKIKLRDNLKSTFIFVSLLYIFASLPLTMVFLGSDRLRFTYFEIISQVVAQVKPLKYVFIGDSITKAGNNWGWELERNPAISKNLAVNGYTTKQIRAKLSEALGYNPRYIFILAGTNDSRNKNITVEQTINEYELLLDTFTGHNSQPVITLVPLQSQSFESANVKVKQINQALSQIANERQIALIDLNPVVAPDGYLLAQYSNDGVHFTEAAYQVWRNKINNFLTQANPISSANENS